MAVETAYTIRYLYFSADRFLLSNAGFPVREAVVSCVECRSPESAVLPNAAPKGNITGNIAGNSLAVGLVDRARLRTSPFSRLFPVCAANVVCFVLRGFVGCKAPYARRSAPCRFRNWIDGNSISGR